MEIGKIIAICLVGTIFAVLLKKENPQLAVLKVIGIAYLTQFGAQLCADAGEGTVAAKIELAGKILMMTAAAPVLIGLLELVMGLV